MAAFPPAGPARRGIRPQFYLFVAALGGTSQGFVTVTLGYVLASRGFSVAAVATVIGFRLLPETWRVLFGPLLDLCLDPRLWFLISAAGSALCTAAFGLVPLRPADAIGLDGLALALGVFANLGIVAQAATIGGTADPAVRGKIAGWSQAGNLGGIGIGGGAGLWLAAHLGMIVAAPAIGLWAASCAWPMLLARTPRAGAAVPLSATARMLVREVATLLSTRVGLLAILAVTLPMGLGSFLGLLSSVAADWHASADLTAATTGVLAGLLSVPGCLIGGYLCDRRPPQTILAWSGVVCALGEAAMALAPRSPACFVAFALLNNLLLGCAWAACAAVMFAVLRPAGGGTIGALLGSLCNVPTVAMTFVLGATEARHGVTGMMGIEAVLGVLSAALYGMIARFWRPRPVLAIA